MAKVSKENHVLAPLRTQGEKLLADAEGYKVKKQDDADEINNALIRITAGLKELEKKRTERTGPINESLRIINGDFKRVAGPYQEAKRILTQKLMDYRAEQRRKDREAELEARKEEDRRRKIQAAHEEAGHKVEEDITPVTRPTTFETMDTTKTRKNWTFEVIEKAKMPLEYLVVDETAIRKAIRAADRDEEDIPVIEIPGVRIYAEEVPVFG